MRRIYTIGYGNKGLKSLLERLYIALKKSGSYYFLVFDVRARPHSWCAELSHPAIAKHLQIAGHEYQWCHYLGNNGDAQEVRLIDERLGMAELRAALGRLPPTEELVLLCAEHNPSRCHRTVIADRARELWEVEVIHL